MMKHYVSCSFGKDSVATALLALEHGDPLDGLVFAEVMYDHQRNISGEIPEHIEWIHNVAIPWFEQRGVPTIILRGKRDFLSIFHRPKMKGKHVGQITGFPLIGLCQLNRDCKVRTIRNWVRQQDEEITFYVGIAADELARLQRLTPP